MVVKWSRRGAGPFDSSSPRETSQNSGVATAGAGCVPEEGFGLATVPA